MKKLYQVKVHTQEQLGLSGVGLFEGIQVLDDEQDLNEQIKIIYLQDYDITITSIEYEEITFDKYNIIIEEKSGYVVVLHHCKDGTLRMESRLLNEYPDDSFVNGFKNRFGAEKTTIEKR